MKKLVSLLLALALLLGCVSFSVAEDATHIVFWHSMSDEAGVLMEKFIADFNATVGAEKGIEVEAVYQGTYAEATQKLRSILSAGQLSELPDVMQMDATGKVTYFTSGAAYTVDQQIADNPDTDVSALLPAAMGNWNFSGVQLGVPFATSTTVMYYNKTLLEKAGAEVPATFADISAMAAKLPATADNGNALVPYAAVPNTPTIANWIGQLGSYVVNNANGSLATATALDCIENGALAAFLTEWKAMYAAGGVANHAGSTDEFVAGNLAIMTSSSSNVTSLTDRIGGAFELGVAFYPRVNEAASCGATASGSCLVMFDTAVKAASWELISYLTGAQVQADFAVGTGYIPSNTAAMDTDAWKDLIAVNPLYTVALEQMAATPGTMRSVTVGPAADFYYAIQNCVSDMLDEDISVEEAVDMMADELGGLLDQYTKANQ